MDGSARQILYGWPGAPLLRRLDHYARLMRLNRPIGIGLLLWPTLWALWVAARGLPDGPQFPDAKLLWVFIAGTVVMRSAGCVINDFADRNIDPHVKRTRERPLALRMVSPREALTLFAVLVLLALWLVTRLDWKTVQYAFVGAALTISYPLMKRFFPLPQFYLGAAFGWAVPMAFVATLGGVPQLGWLLFVVTLLWAGVYDTQYAMVDRDDDLKIGVESTAIAFGDMDRVLIGAMQLMVLAGLAFTGRALLLHWPFWLALAGAALLFAWQQWLTRRREPASCFKAFLNNNWVGMLVLAGFIAG
ncbi:MAG TPA: 4-hydroxybenzoate octaprenyltransferase [Steroidobacteraceae bacterium]|nr:4-hydroxybenzoate octaprenyltransferase [Steroidobacteraceae bacterium]